MFVCMHAYVRMYIQTCVSVHLPFTRGGSSARKGRTGTNSPKPEPKPKLKPKPKPEPQPKPRRWIGGYRHKFSIDDSLGAVSDGVCACTYAYTYDICIHT